MRTMQTVASFTGLLLAMASAVPQQPSSAPASSPPNTPGSAPDITAPQLLPFQRTSVSSDTCKEESHGTVSLSLVVDRHGMPSNITVLNPTDSAMEKFALRLVAEDSFKPATLNNQAIEAKGSLSISIQACFATAEDKAGTTTEVLRLREQPIQTLAQFSPTQTSAQRAATDAASLGIPNQLTGRSPGVTPPVPLNYVEAEFSEEARRGGFSGICLVSVTVDIKGRPQNPRVVRALGHGLDEKAIEAVKKYRFKPAMKDGIPVPIQITVEVNFRFRNW